MNGNTQQVLDPPAIIGPERQLDIYIQCDLLDVLINNDNGMLNDLVLRSFNTYCSTGWASFVVALRLHEQLAKMTTPSLDPRKDIGHDLTKWHDAVQMNRGGRFSDDDEFVSGMNRGYAWWNAIFQSPWSTYRELLDRTKNSRGNQKAYSLLEPDEEHSKIHPLLPLALADATRMLSGQLDQRGRGVRVVDTTPGHLRQTISRTFVDNAGINLDIDQINRIIKRVGYLVLWSRVFNLLKSCKRTVGDRASFEIKYRDGSSRIVKGERPSQGCYGYHDSGIAKLMETFGTEELAGAHLDVATVLANTRDWRLQNFIKCSEYRELAMVDGVLTDTTKGNWRRGRV